MSKRRILLIAGFYLPVVGGYIKIINELAKGFVKQGYTVDVLTCLTSSSPHSEVIENINVYRLSAIGLIQGNFPIPMVSRYNIETISELSKHDYYCIITNTRFFPICFIGWLLSRRRGTPLIHLEHGSLHTISESRVVSIMGRIYDHTVGRLIIQSAVWNYGVSAPAVDFLRHLGAQKAKIRHNGINLEQYDTGKRLDTHSDHNAIIITYVGRLIYAKGIQDLLSVLPELTENILVRIVGDGPYRATLERLAHGVNNIPILFYGEQYPDDIPDILKTTDIFVSPSYSEGLPTSVLEACAAGCAVIATDVGGTNEIILDGKTGLLYDPGNKLDLVKKLKYLVQDENYRNSLGRNAKEYVSTNFSWESIMILWAADLEFLENNVTP